MKNEEQYWSNRYEEEKTGWDIGYPSTPLKEYIDQIENKELRILIPGAGNAYEAEYLFEQGFNNVYVLDISKNPLEAFQKRVPNFPEENLIHASFFEFEGQFDLIIEQTFFCAIDPSPDNRKAYAKKVNELLNPNGKLVGLWFTHSLDKGGPPHGGTKQEYESYLNPYFEFKIFEPCHNSIKPRAGKELFGIFIKK
jgi:thiopurine S-methyltransferase